LARTDAGRLAPSLRLEIKAEIKENQIVQR
jgi:hypothetical protein